MSSIGNIFWCDSSNQSWRPAASSRAASVANHLQSIRSSFDTASAAHPDNSYSTSGVTAVYPARLTESERQLAAATKSLREIELLPDGWNDNGAPAFSDRIVTEARHILHILQHVPFVMPTACPSIQMTFEEPLLGYLQFDMFEDGSVERYLEDLNGHTQEDLIAWQEIPQAVSAFYSDQFQT
ncbi:MAG: hypothetical protein HDQ87_09175 [Clostridia bacterium]|nr:hypothetical protein [Clostridia bacterium]